VTGAATTPICLDCAHFVARINGQSSICRRLVGKRWNPVDGTRGEYMAANPHRERATDKALITGREKCGPAGRFFVKRLPPSCAPAQRGG
jgi:hypothetical protein